MKPAALLIRADASARIGTGHVMRCLALAQAWREAGGAVRFAHCETTPALEARLAAEGFSATRIEAAAGSLADAEATIVAARALGAEWVVGDGYALDAAWQLAIRAAGLRLLLIDDYGHAAHYHADVVLNQNTSADAALYTHRDPHTRLLLGPRFALLRREFVSAHARPETPPTDRPLRLLVTLGGSDPDDATSRVLDALAPLPGLELVVVAGGANPHLPALREKIAALPGNPRLVVNVSDMPALMAWADAAVSASGSTVWELARFGVPAALVVTADNQEGIARTLCDLGTARLLGRHPGLDVAALRAALADWLADAEARAASGRIAARLVDGQGARRVRAALSDSLAITLLGDADSWLQPAILELAAGFRAEGHSVRVVHDPRDLGEGGDLAFFLGLGRIVAPELLRRHAHNLVVHESPLPRGRGWSPLTWQILEGKNEIPVTLIEATDGVDEGDVYAARTLAFAGHELVPELRAAQAAATLALCRDFVARYPWSAADARPQTGEPTYYPRRRPADSRIDPTRPLIEQFNLLRVCDPERYPAYFEHAGRRYEIVVRPAPAA